MTLRLDTMTLKRLDQLAEVTERSKAWLAAQAVKEYLELNEWQTQAIAAAVKRADSRSARFVDHEKVSAWFDTWARRKNVSRRCENPRARSSGGRSGQREKRYRAGQSPRRP